MERGWTGNARRLSQRRPGDDRGLHLERRDLRIRGESGGLFHQIDSAFPSRHGWPETPIESAVSVEAVAQGA